MAWPKRWPAAGFHVELPRLPGHGTTIDDMIPTRWDDWTAEVESAYQRLAARTDSIVVAGLSMGGSLTLWTGLEHPEVAGLVCVNPATVPPPPEIAEMLAEMLADGTRDDARHRSPTSPIPTSSRSPTRARRCARCGR